MQFVVLVMFWVPLEVLGLLLSSQQFGVAWTFLWVIATGVVGLILTLYGTSQALVGLNNMELGSQELRRHIRLVLAGIFLFFPGLLTDAFGLFLLIPGLGSRMLERQLLTRIGRIRKPSARPHQGYTTFYDNLDLKRAPRDVTPNPPQAEAPIPQFGLRIHVATDSVANNGIGNGNDSAAQPQVLPLKPDKDIGQTLYR